ncbi:MAG: hypothetical protein EOP48_26690 [Sphingobacteriales bacterium]|nr:MAG: hypothetical protein EOP48_26690 [Sphingobacteriales bacterium]
MNFHEISHEIGSLNDSIRQTEAENSGLTSLPTFEMDKTLEAPLEEISLKSFSRGTYNVLKRINIDSMELLSNAPPEIVMLQKGVSRLTLLEIALTLRARGFNADNYFNYLNYLPNFKRVSISSKLAHQPFCLPNKKLK